MTFDKQKFNQILFLIILGIVFLSLIVLLFRSFQTSEHEKLINKELKELKEKQRTLEKNDEKNYLKLDSLQKTVKNLESNRAVEIERYYTTKEIIKEKFIKNEKDIIDNNISSDSIRSFLSKYKYKSYDFQRAGNGNL